MSDDRSDLEEAIRLLRWYRASLNYGHQPEAQMATDALLARHPEKPKLLPCAHCGQAANLDDGYGKIRIKCIGCGVKVTRDTIDARRHAIDAWNRRATPASGPLSGGKPE